VTKSRDQLFEFWEPLYVSGTVEARNFRFGVEIDDNKHYGKNAKLSQRGRDQVT